MLSITLSVSASTSSAAIAMALDQRTPHHDANQPLRLHAARCTSHDIEPVHAHHSAAQAAAKRPTDLGLAPLAASTSPSRPPSRPTARGLARGTAGSGAGTGSSAQRHHARAPARSATLLLHAAMLVQRGGAALAICCSQCMRPQYVTWSEAAAYVCPYVMAYYRGVHCTAVWCLMLSAQE
eukprot:COSAG06_NODE_12118_length_1421_cov_1.654312_1_plen_181_part_00